MTSKTTFVYPVISSVQKIALYETKARFFLVGSNNTQTKFRVLKIDRTELKELIVIDDKMEYTHKEIRDLLTMIDVGNRPRPGQKSSGLNRTVSAFGIVGFIKFLEGYYIILVTKRRRVAVIGHHTIYKIEDTSMVYIPSEGEKYSNPDEARYVKMFQNVDLSSNFYFSYSYDITHTLQYNLRPLKKMTSVDSQKIEQVKTIPCWNPQMKSTTGTAVEVAENFLENLQVHSEGFPKPQFHANTHANLEDNASSSSSENEVWSELRLQEEHLISSVCSDSDICYGARTKANEKFVWNTYLLEPVDLHPDWLLYITHGFIGQSNINVYGRPLYLTLIARRSQKFAGTRFLKRGANFEGDVANEVETEQIVHDSSVSSLATGHYTAFVQMRGSIPSQWSQDTSKMVPKPQITLDAKDPYCFAAGRHFNQLICRYGAPIIVLNLVKKREQKKHESILSEEIIGTINYLNQFLPPMHQIEHIGFDMARIDKSKEANVMARLAEISCYVVKRVGFFQSWPSYYCQQMRSHRLGIGGLQTEQGTYIQTGIVRVNCVDCLDRTNTAQFSLGKCALAFQLYALGVLESPSLEFDTDVVRMLEELYEDHGDTLALQYGGSQLVHRIKTYRKIAPLSSHSRDIMQTLSRYYSNTFSDADKQNAINLYLGVYKAEQEKLPIWELTTDNYLHNSVASGQLICHRNLYTQWWNGDVAKCLPQALEEVQKSQNKSTVELIGVHPTDEKIDGFFEHYRPYEMTVISDLFSFNISHSIRDFMPNFATDYSPFSVRVRPGKRRESMGTDKPPNPSVTGISSSASASSGTSETESGESSDEDYHFIRDNENSSSSDSSAKLTSFQSLFPTMKETYGTEICKPSDPNMNLYKQYSNLGKIAGVYGFELNSNELPRRLSKSVNLIRQSVFTLDSLYQVTLPTVSRKDKDIYKAYVQRGKVGANYPSRRNIILYHEYAAVK
ncbi:polyphosphoinositide phosphatase [Centruroides vittatus]|uniref:polyphosphoinositide phosphatase n=1 Tax=Centruroides vittatus TaxID=120091 RepID=UPI00350F5EBA